MDVSQYLEIFIDESNEHLQNLSDGIMILEKEPDNSDTINEIFRAAHSLKGMAGTMGYKRMQNLISALSSPWSAEFLNRCIIGSPISSITVLSSSVSSPDI